jgi:hypothetical protein
MSMPKSRPPSPATTEKKEIVAALGGKIGRQVRGGWSCLCHGMCPLAQFMLPLDSAIEAGRRKEISGQDSTIRLRSSAQFQSTITATEEYTHSIELNEMRVF